MPKEVSSLFTNLYINIGTLLPENLALSTATATTVVLAGTQTAGKVANSLANIASLLALPTLAAIDSVLAWHADGAEERHLRGHNELQREHGKKP